MGMGNQEKTNRVQCSRMAFGEHLLVPFIPRSLFHSPQNSEMCPVITPILERTNLRLREGEYLVPKLTARIGVGNPTEWAVHPSLHVCLDWVVEKEVPGSCELLKEWPTSATLSIFSPDAQCQVQKKVKKYCLVALWTTEIPRQKGLEECAYPVLISPSVIMAHCLINWILNGQSKI